MNLKDIIHDLLPSQGKSIRSFFSLDREIAG